MNKKEITQRVAVASGISEVKTALVMEKLFEEIVTAVANGDKVSFKGFGIFRSRKLAARRRVLSFTGTRKEIEIPARLVPIFDPALRFKQILESTQATPS